MLNGLFVYFCHIALAHFDTLYLILSSIVVMAYLYTLSLDTQINSLGLGNETDF